jgi:hypothetical protein
MEKTNENGQVEERKFSVAIRMKDGAMKKEYEVGKVMTLKEYVDYINKNHDKITGSSMHSMDREYD